MLNRAYSTLEIKSIDEDLRIIRGIASTPSPDHAGDIVEPLGAEFTLPMPFLWQHDKGQPIGHVTHVDVSPKQICIDVQIAPAGVTPKIDEAWALIKARLVRGLSIGFGAKAFELLKDGSGGRRFKSWKWHETSAVTIPANAEASISLIKSIDDTQLAATGQRLRTVVRLEDPPGDSGTTKAQPAASGLFVAPKGPPTVKTLQEQISAFEAKRAATAGQIADIVNKSLETGETLDADTKLKRTDLANEIKEIDEHIVMLKESEQIMLTRATPVSKTIGTQAASESRSGVLSVTRNLPKGTAFARYVKTLAASKGNLMQAAEIAKSYESTTPEVGMVLKAAVAAGTTTDAAWAAPLVPYQQMTTEFIELLRPATIIGRILGLRNVPFNIKMPTQTGGSTVNWVGQAAPKPVSALAFASLTLDFTKTAGIVVMSQELVRLSTPSAEAIVRQDLIDQTAQFLDAAFVDPSKAAVSGVSPASITNGATAIAASGTSADALRADLRKLFAAFTAVNLSSAGAVWIMTETQWTAISMMVNALGQPEFPGAMGTDGTLWGLPVITSESVVKTTAGTPAVTTAAIILVKASEILLADDGGVAIDVSDQASLQMDSAPTNPPVAATVLVSLWQMNLVGIRAERWINWVRRRPGAVAYISDANYG